LSKVKYLNSFATLIKEKTENDILEIKSDRSLFGVIISTIISSISKLKQKLTRIVNSQQTHDPLNAMLFSSIK
jgi:hypothetical protein